jgi:hypothetical protein
VLDTNEWSTLGSIGGSGSRSERFGMGAMSTGVESGRATTVETAFAKSAATLAGVLGDC